MPFAQVMLTLILLHELDVAEVSHTAISDLLPIGTDIVMGIDHHIFFFLRTMPVEYGRYIFFTTPPILYKSPPLGLSYRGPIGGSFVGGVV